MALEPLQDVTRRIVGTALGFLVASTATSQDTVIPFNKGLWVAESALGGAETGAIIGVFVGKRVWTRAEPAWFINAVRIGPHMMGAQFAVRYSR